MKPSAPTGWNLGAMVKFTLQHIYCTRPSIATTRIKLQSIDQPTSIIIDNSLGRGGKQNTCEM